jgi:transcriptional regulator with XRE-family HTH domain
VGLSQEELAERAGLHWTFVSGVERGVRNPSLHSIGKLARALHEPLDALFRGLEAEEHGEPSRRCTRR